MAQRQLATAFAELTDTLVDGFDVIDFLHTLTRRAAALTAAGLAGIVLGDQRDRLRPVAASSEQPRLVEVFERQSEEGPSLDCFVSGRPVRDARLDDGRWPRFAPAARAAGFTVADALPLRLRGRTLGALNLFRNGGGLGPDEAALAQSLADIATIGVLAERAVTEHETLAEQLQGTLNGRILVEQAKGVLAERHGWSMDEAFAGLRRAAHERGVPLRELAAAVVAGEPIGGDPGSSTR
jgi:hypothetical protein